MVARTPGSMHLQLTQGRSGQVRRGGRLGRCRGKAQETRLRFVMWTEVGAFWTDGGLFIQSQASPPSAAFLCKLTFPLQKGNISVSRAPLVSAVPQNNPHAQRGTFQGSTSRRPAVCVPIHVYTQMHAHTKSTHITACVCVCLIPAIILPDIF